MKRFWSWWDHVVAGKLHSHVDGMGCTMWCRYEHHICTPTDCPRNETAK